MPKDTHATCINTKMLSSAKRAETKRRFGESGAQPFWVSLPWELIKKVRVV